MKTLKKLAQEALDVQDASNLSGIVHSFAEALTNLRQLDPKLSTQDVNRHPIALLYASKITSLTGYNDDQSDPNYTNSFSFNYNWAKDLIK